MEDALNLIVRQPSSGHSREDIPNGYLAWNAGKHVIIYRMDKEVIYVIRVLHQRMDFTYKFR